MKREDSGLSVFYRENKRVFAFDSNNEPVAEVMDGETVIFRTHDCFDNQLSEEGSCIGALNWDRIHPTKNLKRLCLPHVFFLKSFRREDTESISLPTAKSSFLFSFD